MTLEVTILGCGSSGGVPRVGNLWGQCDPDNPRNRRLRCSIAVRQTGTEGSTVLLVDTSPDLRQQLLRADLNWLDGVFFTHDHADHTHGIDELRVIAIHARKRLDVYMDDNAAATLKKRFYYCFETPEDSIYHPFLNSHALTPYNPVTVNGEGGAMQVLPFEVKHGQGTALGFRVGNVAYTPDLSGITDQTLEVLQDLEVWILNALRYKTHPAHLSVDQALALVEKVKPRRAILTHLHVDLDYEELRQSLPDHIEPAYDGLVIRS